MQIISNRYETIAIALDLTLQEIRDAQHFRQIAESLQQDRLETLLHKNLGTGCAMLNFEYGVFGGGGGNAAVMHLFDLKEKHVRFCSTEDGSPRAVLKWNGRHFILEFDQNWKGAKQARLRGHLASRVLLHAPDLTYQQAYALTKVLASDVEWWNRQ